MNFNCSFSETVETKRTLRYRYFHNLGWLFNIFLILFLALADEEGEWKPRKDDYYDMAAERKDKSQHESERKKTLAKQGYIKR